MNKQTKIGIIPEDWETDTLGNHTKLIKGISYRSEDYCLKDEGFIFINLKSVARNGGFREEGIKYYKGELREDQFVNAGDILIANTDLTQNREIIGSPLKVPNFKNDRKMCISLDLSKLDVTSKKLNSDFLYYFLMSPRARHFMIANGNGTTVIHLSTKNVPNMIIPLPRIEEQKQIASLLSSLDDKIEMNNQINKNLEEIAQAIFKHWFIDFEFPNENGEPYKSSGGEMIDSELGLIPKGWRVGKIGDYVEVKSGFAFKNKWWEKYGIPVIKIKNLKNKTIDFSNISYISKDKVNNNILKFFVNSGDILIAMTGATVGKIALVPKRNSCALVNQRVGKFFLGEKPLEKLGFICSILSKKEIFTEIVSTAHGSAQPNISPIQIKNIKIILPFKKYIDKYNKIVEPNFCKITENINQNEYLSNLRDTLLPKLMSGEIRVPINSKILISKNN